MIVQRCLLSISLACLANPAWAAGDKGDPPMEKQSKVEQPLTEPRDSKNPQSPRTPRKFTPSEEISADSAVAFPVDI